MTCYKVLFIFLATVSYFVYGKERRKFESSSVEDLEQNYYGYHDIEDIHNAPEKRDESYKEKDEGFRDDDLKKSPNKTESDGPFTHDNSHVKEELYVNSQGNNEQDTTEPQLNIPNKSNEEELPIRRRRPPRIRKGDTVSKKMEDDYDSYIQENQSNSMKTPKSNRRNIEGRRRDQSFSMKSKNPNKKRKPSKKFRRHHRGHHHHHYRSKRPKNNKLHKNQKKNRKTTQEIMKDNEHDENVVTDDSSHLESVNQYGDSNYIDDGEVNQEQRLSDKSLTEEIFVTLPTIASTQKPQNDSAYSEKISKRMNGRTLRLGDAKGEYYKSISYDDGASQQKINYNSYIPSSSLTSNYEASLIKPSSMPFNKDNEQTELRTDPNIQFDTHKNINLDRGSDPIAKDSFIQESNVETNKRGFEPESEYKNNYRLESKEEGNGTFREGYEDLEYENSGSESTEDEKEKFIQMSEEDEYKQESEEEEKDYIKHSSVQNEDASLNKEYNEQLEEHGNFKDKLDIIDDQSQFDHKYENKFREEASKVKSRTPKISKHKIQLYQSKLSKRRYHERPGSINDHSDRYDKNDNYGRESNLENEENYSQRDNNSDNEDYQYDSDYADDYNFHNKGLEQKFNSRKDKHYKRERKQEDEHGRHHSYDKNYKHEPDLEENERYPQNGDLSENKHGDRSQNRISFHDRDKYNKRGYDPDDGGGGMYHHSSHRHNKREPVLDSDRKNSLSDDFSDERYRQDSDYVEDDYGHSSKKIHPISEDHDKSYYDEKEYDGKYRLYSEENSLEKERSNSMNNKHYYGGLKLENQNVSISGKEGKSLRSYHEKDRYMNDQLGNNKRHRYKEISHKDNHHHRIQDDLENKNSHPPKMVYKDSEPINENQLRQSTHLDDDKKLQRRSHHMEDKLSKSNDEESYHGSYRKDIKQKHELVNERLFQKVLDQKFLKKSHGLKGRKRLRGASPLAQPRNSNNLRVYDKVKKKYHDRNLYGNGAKLLQQVSDLPSDKYYREDTNLGQMQKVNNNNSLPVVGGRRQKYYGPIGQLPQTLSNIEGTGVLKQGAVPSGDLTQRGIPSLYPVNPQILPEKNEGSQQIHNINNPVDETKELKSARLSYNQPLRKENVVEEKILRAENLSSPLQKGINPNIQVSNVDINGEVLNEKLIDERKGSLGGQTSNITAGLQSQSKKGSFKQGGVRHRFSVIHNPHVHQGSDPAAGGSQPTYLSNEIPYNPGNNTQTILPPQT